MRNTTKVVLAPEKDFWIDRGKRQSSKKQEFNPEKGRKNPEKRGIVLTRLKTFSKPLDFENKASYLTFVFASF